jgi:hypothetical protein
MKNQNKITAISELIKALCSDDLEIRPLLWFKEHANGPYPLNRMNRKFLAQTWITIINRNNYKN